MRSHWRILPFLIPALAAAFGLAAPSESPTTSDLGLQQSKFVSTYESLLYKRDEHGHHHMGAPLTELNETEILLHHAPTPPSYWSIDFEDEASDDRRYPGLMGLHILFMGLAFFGALPIGACMRVCVSLDPRRDYLHTVFHTQVLLSVP